MVSCDGEQSIMFWVVKDFNKGNTCIRTTTDYNEVTQVSFSPDSKAVLASLKNSNSTRVYKIAKKPTGGSYELISACDVADLNPKSALIKARIGVQLQNGIQVGAFLFHQYVDRSESIFIFKMKVLKLIVGDSNKVMWLSQICADVSWLELNVKVALIIKLNYQNVENILPFVAILRN